MTFLNLWSIHFKSVGYNAKSLRPNLDVELFRKVLKAKQKTYPAKRLAFPNDIFDQ